MELGWSPWPVAQDVRRTGLPLLAVLITHEHPDHIGGLPAIRAAYPHVPVYASTQTAALMHADPGGHVTPALIEGASCGWLTDIGTLQRAYPAARVAYPGHGARSPATGEQAQTRAYLQYFRTLVGRRWQRRRPAVRP